MPLRKNEPVVIVPYDPHWKTVFHELKTVLAKQLRGHIIDIIHIGSTAIPGLAAKPIIDLNIIIENYDILHLISDLLSGLGYQFEGEKGIEGRFAFARKSKYVPYYINNNNENTIWMDHHLYVCSKDNPENKRQVLFRDYLREHSDALREYAELKVELAAKYKNDRVKYTESKGTFIEKIIRKAGNKNGTI